ncbi:Chemokine XC receptor 1 G-protein coupled receptor 5 [Triplophysa tibetana]|uniref:Chemokine XC receptor 1 G-protein coupled receptor 5 n=1 Tax=Triplophysa tibetana TaxID=1572043 RepID=A0A5A9NUN6_9TELE|nr:Chemokine XC receptor 1 G-protein coupled receptor 5 [Triplophysa tibetana]KAA0712027.1 Chemokine XC receptor 1 G-protein coupled receptor 5 [Triplophysa tibetana]
MNELNATYDYESDYEDEICHKEEVLKVGSILTSIFLILVVVWNCIGNILVLIVLVLYESFRSLSNILILNLALSDLLFTFGLPFWVSYHIWGWTFGDDCCKAVTFVFYAGFYSSVLFLTLMTVQRYMAVVHPLSDWERCRGFSIAPIFIIWILSAGAALLGTLRMKVIEESPTSIYCEYDSIRIKLAIIYLQNIFFFITFLIMGFCYTRMLQIITQARTNRRHKTVRLILCISLVFFIGWAPYNIVMFLRSLTDLGFSQFTICEVSIKLEYAFFACRLLAYSHCCLNPVLYVFVGVKFRNHLKVILRRIF